MKHRTYFPDEILEKIFSTITSNEDRNNISLVSKAWNNVEGLSRRRVLIRNCYAVSADRMTMRFSNMRSLILEGKPMLDEDVRVMKKGGGWGADALPWICLLVRACPLMEEFCFKRMVVTDRSLIKISFSFPNVKCLILDACEGFTTTGLGTVAAQCRNLEVLDLQTSVCDDENHDWLGYFPETFHTLVCLKFASYRGQVNLDSLQRLIAQCPNLRILRLNKSVPFTRLLNILQSALNLIDLGIGSDLWNPNRQEFLTFFRVVNKCTSLKTLTGFFQSNQIFSLLAFKSLHSKLIELDLSYARQIPASQLARIVQNCRRLQRLWILDTVGDTGLEGIVSSCKDLQDLRVLVSREFGQSHVTEQGLFAISRCCSRLRTLTYCCYQMTNAALISLAENCPHLTHFKLRLRCPGDSDATTLDTLDEGFCAISYSCKGLKTLFLTGLLTDKAFLYIGMYAEQLETLSVLFFGNCDQGVHYVLNGCHKLRQLELRNCPVGDVLVQENVRRFEALQFLWVSDGDITKGSCKALAKMAPMLNLEIINEGTETECIPDDLLKVKKLYLYRTIAGPRKDAPKYIWTAK